MKIKIIFVQGSFRLGGGERQMLYLLNNINREIFEPFLIAFTSEGPLFNEISDDIEVFDFKGIRRNKLTRLYFLYKIISAIKPEIVYSNLAGTNIPLAIIRYLTKPFWKNTKFVASVVNNVDYYKPRKRKLSYWLYPNIDYILACATGLYNLLKSELNLKQDKIDILFNAVDIDFIRKRSMESIEHPWFNNEVPVVITVASLIPQKSIQDLIYAFEIVKKKIQARLIIIGDGEERQKLEALVNDLHINKDVEFLGYQSNPNKFVSKADVFVLPSHFEGLATVLLESAITKTPIVCTNAPFGSADVVKNDSLGIITDVGNIDEIANGIIKMIIDKEYAKKTSLLLYNHVIEEFSIKSVMKKFENIVCNLI